jgi:intein/homing endonuclease
VAELAHVRRTSSLEILRMIVQAQNIKPGMIIYLPRKKELFTVEQILIFDGSSDFVDSKGGLVYADHGIPISVVGFAND